MSRQPSPSNIAATTHPVGTSCIACEYDLSRVVFGPCPECGANRDAGYARRLQKPERWIRVITRRERLPREIVLAVGGLVSLLALCISPLMLLLAIFLIAPSITLGLGHLALALSRPRYTLLHHTVWSQLHLRLWMPIWSFVPATFAALTMLVAFSSLGDATPRVAAFTFILVNIGFATFILLHTIAHWRSRIQRITTKLEVGNTLWSPRVFWLPIAILCISTALGLLPAALIRFALLN